jgi:LemA protein
VKPNFTVANEAAVSKPPTVDFGRPAPGAPGAAPAPAPAPAAPAVPAPAPAPEKKADATDAAGELMKKGY